MDDKARERVVAGGAGATSAPAGERTGAPSGRVAGAAPHTRPGDQNALCLETDQA